MESPSIISKETTSHEDNFSIEIEPDLSSGGKSTPLAEKGQIGIEKEITSTEKISIRLPSQDQEYEPFFRNLLNEMRTSNSDPEMFFAQLQALIETITQWLIKRSLQIESLQHFPSETSSEEIFLIQDEARFVSDTIDDCIYLLKSNDFRLKEECIVALCKLQGRVSSLKESISIIQNQIAIQESEVETEQTTRQELPETEKRQVILKKLSKQQKQEAVNAFNKDSEKALLPETKEPKMTSMRSEKLMNACSQKISESKKTLNAKQNIRSIDDLKQQLENLKILSLELESCLQMIEDFENCEQISSEDHEHIQQIKNDLKEIRHLSKDNQKGVRSTLTKITRIENEIQTIQVSISLIENQVANSDESFSSDEIQERWIDQVVCFVIMFRFLFI